VSPSTAPLIVIYMGKILVNGAGLAYDEAGSGPAVVFVHAGIADRRMWEHQFRTLSERYRVIRYDWRGRGQSDDVTANVTHYRDLLELLDALAVDQAALVGCSMGGSYSIEVALAAPDRVTALVPICSGLSGHEWPATFRERAAEYIVSGADPEDSAEGYLRFMLPDLADDDARSSDARRLALHMLLGVLKRGTAATEEHLEPGPKERLSEIAAPTLVINGLNDVPEIQQVSDILTKEIPGARRIDLAGTGHLPPVERPGEVTEAIMQFLTSSI
jgi:pimeloyl-ACP methyl ester carboxylesterase